MKRKTILLWLSLCVLALIFASPAFAQTGNVDISKTDNGDTVTYEVNLTPNATINAADINISYDPAALEPVSIQRGVIASADNTIMATNHDADAHVVYISYASLNDNSGGGTICVITFNKLATESTETSETTQTDTPVIGVDIEGVYNEAGETLSPIVTGDNTVAVVASGKKITDSDSGAKAVTLSTEAMDMSKKGVSTTNPDVSNPEAEADMPNGTTTSNTSTGLSTGAIIGIIAAIIVIAAVVIIVMIKKKPKETETIEELEA